MIWRLRKISDSNASTMTQKQPHAQFVPIPPNFDLHALVECTENLQYVTRVSKEILKHQSIFNFEALISAVVIQGGKPLVLEGWESNLLPTLFSRQWLEGNYGSKPENVRDIPNETSIPMTIGHYLRSMDQLTRQITTSNFKDPRRQRLYMKDIDCPEAWANHLELITPGCIYYLNENIGSTIDEDFNSPEVNSHGQRIYTQKCVAPAGDLMSSLPPEMRALNLMCYIGHEGTYTAAHREMCGTLGHNLMVEASKDLGEEKEGSSIWFMTETKEREVVLEYFSSKLGHDVDLEKHFAQVNAWKRAPFNVWVVEQKVGDLILIPPLAPHQVWNRGTRTIKAAWNRTTVDTLELALYEALPHSRMVCRDEQYKCKAIVYYTLKKYSKILQDTIDEKSWQCKRINQILDDFKRLFHLYQQIILSETFSSKLPAEKDVEMLPFDSNVTCSYCRCNIFNRFLTCKACNLDDTGNDEDTYDICMECYAMGRSCACFSNLKWVEQWEWKTLRNCYDIWRGIIIRFESNIDVTKFPQSFQVARRYYGKKSVAQICQEQMRIRPREITKKTSHHSPEMFGSKNNTEEEDWQMTSNRRKRPRTSKSKKRRSNLTNIQTHRCHICRRNEWDWKMAFCSTCSLSYCYGVLWREFDLMPQTVMEQNKWRCPRCLKICSCKNCRNSPTQIPYETERTLLGHDTKKVADYRSVESLVDFSRTKLTRLHESVSNPQASVRLKRLKEKVKSEKAKVDTFEEIYLNRVGELDIFRKEENSTFTSKSISNIDPFLCDLTISTENSNEQNPLKRLIDCCDKFSMTNGSNRSMGPSELLTECELNPCIDGINISDRVEKYQVNERDLMCTDSIDHESDTSSAFKMRSEQIYPDPSFMSEYSVVVDVLDIVDDVSQEQSNGFDSIIYGR